MAVASRIRGSLAGVLSAALIVSGALLAAPAAYAEEAPTEPTELAHSSVAHAGTGDDEGAGQPEALSNEDPAGPVSDETSEGEAPEVAPTSDAPVLDTPATDALAGDLDPAEGTGDEESQSEGAGDGADVADAAAQSTSKPQIATRAVTWTPEISVALADGTPLSAGDKVYQGETIVVKGKGFDPLSHPAQGRPPVTAGDSSGNYVVFGNFGEAWQPSTGAASSERVASDQRWAMTDATFNNLAPQYAPGVAGQRVALTEAGTFELELQASAIAADKVAPESGSYGVFTYVAGGGANDAAQELGLRLNYVDAERPEWEPAISVTLADGTPLAAGDPVYEGETIVVKGKGFDPLSHPAIGRPPVTAGDPTGNYVVFGNFAEAWQPSTGAAGSERVVADQRWAMTDATFNNLNPMFAGGVAGQRVVLTEEGTFELALQAQAIAADKVAPESGSYGVFTYVAGGGANDAAQELELRLTYAEGERPRITVELEDGTSLAGGAKVYEGETLIVKGSGFDPLSHPAMGRPPVTAGDPSGNYVVFGNFGVSWQPSTGAETPERSVADQRWAMSDATFNNLNPRYVEGVAGQRVVLTTEGTFEAQLTVKSSAATPGSYGVFTYVAGGGANDPAQELELRLDFAEGERPVAPETTEVLVTDTSVTDDGLLVSVTATGLPGDIYAALIEKGSESTLGPEGGYAAFALPFPTVTDGSSQFNLLALSEDLDRSLQYEVIVWQLHGTPSESTIYGRADVAVTTAQWDALEGIVTTPPVTTPPAEKSPAAGSLIWGVSSGFADYTKGDIARGDVFTSGVGNSGGRYLFPQATGGNWNFETRTGTVRYSGVVAFTGHHGLMNESFSNPVITVTSPIAGTISAGNRTFNLSLLRGVMTENSDGSVTWSNVPVLGSISGGGTGTGGTGGGTFAVDPITFTVGAVSNVVYGTTSSGANDQKREPAATPPATTGLTIVTDPADIITGSSVEITAEGFEPNETDILVVIYSDPIVLDEHAKADANGVVRWIGSLPAELEGDHTLTLQGSINVGTEITILPAGTPEAVALAAEGGLAEEEAVATPISAPVENDFTWLWWGAAIALLAAAGATTAAVVSQRRKAAAAANVI